MENDSNNQEIIARDDVQYIVQPSGQSDLPLNVNDLNNLNTSLNGGSKLRPNEGKAPGLLGSIPRPITDNTIEVAWRNLTYTVETSIIYRIIKKEEERVKVILKGLTGYFRSGQLTAIMGPSGAGKSTLLECVSGKRKRGLSGDVRIIGADNIKIGLIAQSDYLISQLSVKESLMYASKLKNYKKNIEVSLEEVVVGDPQATDSNVKTRGGYHQMLVKNVMKQLGLEVCADTKSGSCSGGQRKRLSIALELISKPNILILDEPTSGLDSSACYQTVSVMQQLTQQYQSKHPIAVVATIHQPSARVFNLFHHVYVISFDGQCIYQGNPQDLLQTLANVGLNCPQFHNPADYIAEVASGEHGQEGIVKLANQKKRIDAMMPLMSGPKTLTLAQISNQQSYPSFLHTWILFWRSLVTILRDPMLTSLRFFSHLITAVFIGLLYGDTIGKPGGCPPQVSPLNDLEHFAEYREKYEKETITITENVAFIFFTLMFIMFGAMMPTIMTFPIDMQVFRKERTNGWYSTATYYFAKTIADMPFQFIFPTVFTGVCYYMTGQDESFGRFLAFSGVCIGIALVAQSQGLLIGAIFMEDASAAVFLGPISCIPMLLFAGFFVRISTIPWFFRPMTYISYLRYSFEALIGVIYGHGRCPFNPALANSTSEKPEWLDYLVQIFKGAEGDDGTDTEKFVENLLKNLGGQAYTGEDGSGYKSLVLDQFEINDQTLIWNCLALLTVFLILRIATYGILLWKVNSRD